MSQFLDMNGLVHYNGIIQPPLADIIDSGAKNIANMSLSSFTTLTKDGVTVTLTDDLITTSGTGGTNSNNFFNIFYKPDVMLIPPGNWVGMIDGTGIENFRIEIYYNTASDTQKGLFGQPFAFTIPDNITYSFLRITSKPSTDCTGSFKLMICAQTFWNISKKYVPYGNGSITDAQIDSLWNTNS